MCGIAGFAFLSGVDAPGFFPSALRDMVSSLRHRGPDSEGFFQRPGLGLGMRRLKVIDLSTGDQPIFSDDGSLCIVFNGEIYNYAALRKGLERAGVRFRTQSDTEVLLRLYEKKGAACLGDLNGMYAFAVHDARAGSLFLARDPLGIKPLYYYADVEKFVFASEIKAILAFPGVSRILSPQAIRHFLSLNYLPAPWTMFAGIQQLEGGTCMRIQGGKVLTEKFWDWPQKTHDSITEDDAVTQTRKLLRKAVAQQMVADVPVGAFLSGGLDSSALVALMKESHTGLIDTFCVGFDEPSYDETPHARKTASFFGTRHHELRLRAADIPRLLERLVLQLDQPLADPAAVALYELSGLTRQHVTVALSGDGSDELFVGYPTYKADRYARWVRGIPSFLMQGIIRPVGALLPTSTEKLSFEYRAKKFLEGMQFEPAKAHYWWRTVCNDGEKAALLREPFGGGPEEMDSYSTYGRHFDEAADLDFTSQCLWADLRVWLAGNNLHKVDAMSMAHSLEARVPFLDQELAEYVMCVPVDVKHKGQRSKFLLRKAMEGILPQEILSRKKAGWHMPFAKWFRGELKEYLVTRFKDQAGPFYAVFDHGGVQQILIEHFAGKKNNAFKIWGLLIMQEWFRVWK